MVTKDDGLGDKEGTGGQAPGDAGRPCTEHAAFGGGWLQNYNHHLHIQDANIL